MPPVDMSPEAVTARLKRVSELSRLCRSLAQAGRKARGKDAKTPPPSREDTHEPGLP